MSEGGITREELIRQINEVRVALLREQTKNYAPESDVLKNQNARLQYRVNHLLKALEEQDKEIEELKKQLEN